MIISGSSPLHFLISMFLKFQIESILTTTTNSNGPNTLVNNKNSFKSVTGVVQLSTPVRSYSIHIALTHILNPLRGGGGGWGGRPGPEPKGGPI